MPQKNFIHVVFTSDIDDECCHICLLAGEARHEASERRALSKRTFCCVSSMNFVTVYVYDPSVYSAVCLTS